MSYAMIENLRAMIDANRATLESVVALYAEIPESEARLAVEDVAEFLRSAGIKLEQSVRLLDAATSPAPE